MKKKDIEYISPKENKYANWLAFISLILILGLFVLALIVKIFSNSLPQKILYIWQLMIPIGITILVFVRINYPTNKFSKIVLIFSVLFFIILMICYGYMLFRSLV